jgi:hypothetical protein
MARIVPSWERLRDRDNGSIGKQVNRPRIVTTVACLMMASLFATVSQAATATRICGSSKAIVDDVHCGGDSANSGVDACGAGQYCCNETNPASCGDTAVATNCSKAADICQMPAAVSQCTDVADPTCQLQSAPIYGCQAGSYCCTNGDDSAPSCNPNIVGLEIYTANCKPKVNICLAVSPTPTPSPTTTPSPTATPSATPTGTPTVTPVPTVTPTPSPLACSGNRRELAVENQSSIPI